MSTLCSGAQALVEVQRCYNSCKDVAFFLALYDHHTSTRSPLCEVDLAYAHSVMLQEHHLALDKPACSPTMNSDQLAPHLSSIFNY